jgi:hypothetical protein
VSEGIARVAEGPYFEELRVGQRFTSAPAITITDGLVSTRQAIIGERSGCRSPRSTSSGAPDPLYVAQMHYGWRFSAILR